MRRMESTPLRRLRLSRHLTLKHVAEAVGLDTGNLSRIEAGKQKSPDMAERLVTFYGRDAIDELQILYPERYDVGPPGPLLMEPPPGPVDDRQIDLPIIAEQGEEAGA